MAIDGQDCKVCGAATLEEIAEFRMLTRVTSDCMPFRKGGRLLTCCTCGAAQSPADEQWLSEIDEIYSSYYAYHQSGGIEQYVSEPATGRLTPRSEVFVNRLLTLDCVPKGGKLLDVGCGTGGTLRAFDKRNGWRLSGLELDDRNLRFLTPINNFDRLYTCAPSDLPGQFDLITLVHTLEHLPDPLPVLQCLRGKIAPEGRLFVEVPNAGVNPFDYLIADHMIHFSPATLSLLIKRAGFGVDCLATDWVAKELSLTSHPNGPSTTPHPDPAGKSLNSTSAQVQWLWRFLEMARATASEGRNIGLFGSSIAATWLYGTLGDKVSFFVDEDPNRVGRKHMGRPILRPDQTPPESIVVLAMAPQAASRIADRLRTAVFDLRLPPPLPAL